MDIDQVVNLRPVAGEFSVGVGRGESDPLPYNATREEIYQGFLQACTRNDRILHTNDSQERSGLTIEGIIAED